MTPGVSIMSLGKKLIGLMKTDVFHLPENIINSPFKFYFFILKKFFLSSLKSIIGILLILASIFFLLLFLRTTKPLFLHAAVYTSGILFLFPFTIALEEFSHAGTCIARGKKSTIKNLLIGYLEINKKRILITWAAIDYFGKFNQIDTFYISAGGPVTTFVVMLILAAIVFLTLSDHHVTSLFFLNAAIPLIALIPSKVIVQTDGSSISDAAKKLRIPLLKIPLELFKSMKYLIQYCLFPRREYHNSFVVPSDILEHIDSLVQENKIPEAINQYEHLLLIEPYNSEFLNNIAWLYYESGQPAKGLKYSKKAVNLSPRDEDFKDTLRKIKKCLNST